MEHSERPHKKPDLATVNDLAKFLRMDRTAVTKVMTIIGVPKRGAGYPWLRTWLALGVDLQTVKDPETLKEPLLELKEVATLLGESPKTTRRRGDGKHQDKSIPAHIDLGPRKRLYFRAEIQSWILGGEPLPFERKQENLSFIPTNMKMNSSSGKKRKAAKVHQTSPHSAAVLFMAPPMPD